MRRNCDQRIGGGEVAYDRLNAQVVGEGVQSVDLANVAIAAEVLVDAPNTRNGVVPQSTAQDIVAAAASDGIRTEPASKCVVVAATDDCVVTVLAVDDIVTEPPTAVSPP